MRVLVAGASGAVGSRLIPMLVAAGESVIWLIRSPSKADALRRAGAIPAVADALDASALRETVVSAQPDIVVHEMTALAMTDCRAGSNAKARQELGWRPAHSSWRQGFAEVMAEQA